MAVVVPVGNWPGSRFSGCRLPRLGLGRQRLGLVGGLVVLWLFGAVQTLQFSSDGVPPGQTGIAAGEFFKGGFCLVEPTRPPQQSAEEQLGLAVGSIGFIRGRCLEKLKAVLEDEGLW